MTTPATEPPADPAPTPPADPAPVPEPPQPPPGPSTDSALATTLRDMAESIKGLPDAIGNIITSQNPAPPAPAQEPPPNNEPDPTPPPGEPEAPASRQRYMGAGGSFHRRWYGEPPQDS